MISPIRAAVRVAVVTALSYPIAALAQEQPAPAPQAAAEPQERSSASKKS